MSTLSLDRGKKLPSLWAFILPPAVATFPRMWGSLEAPLDDFGVANRGDPNPLMWAKVYE